MRKIAIQLSSHRVGDLVNVLLDIVHRTLQIGNRLLLLLYQRTGVIKAGNADGYPAGSALDGDLLVCRSRRFNRLNGERRAIALAAFCSSEHE